MSYFPPCTLILMLVNLFVYQWEVSTGALIDEASIIRAGALYRAHVESGEVWRLASAIFLHGNLNHLMSNSILFYIVGMACEHAFGMRKTFLIYFVSGLFGSCLSVLMSEGPSVGASGAIFGIMSSVIVFLYRHQHLYYIRDKRIGTVLAILALYQLAIGSLTPYIDNAAHLGGLLGGVAAALFFSR